VLHFINTKFGEDNRGKKPNTLHRYTIISLIFRMVAHFQNQRHLREDDIFKITNKITLFFNMHGTITEIF